MTPVLKMHEGHSTIFDHNVYNSIGSSSSGKILPTTQSRALLMVCLKLWLTVIKQWSTPKLAQKKKKEKLTPN